MANMFDRTATAEDDDLDARARSLDSGPTKRDRPSSEGKPSALDRARGRGYETPKEDPIKKAAAENTTPTEAISTRPPRQSTGMSTPVQDYPTNTAQTRTGMSVPGQDYPTNTAQTRTGMSVPGQDYPTNTAQTRTGMSVPGQDYPTNTAERPTGMSTPEQDYPTNTAERPTGMSVPGQDYPTNTAEPNKPVTPPSKSGGGGGSGGAAPGRRKALGDQTRREAYDPIADRADPRNVAIVDDQGRVNPKLAEKGAIDPTAPGVKTGEAAARYTNNYTNSLAGATSYMENMFHQKKGDPNHAEGYQAMTMGAVGAPDQQTVNGVFKVIDPNNELAPKEKMELATRAMHDWYTSRGDSKSADKVAAEMLQYGNKQAQGYGKQVMMALKNGDRQGAVDGIQKAYDWLPDGYHAEVKNNALTITETATGKTINQLPLDDKQIRNLGLGLASGTLYWDIVGQRAGKPGTFTPPAPQPTQAMVTAPPGAAGPSGTPSPAGPASPQAPAAAAPPPSTTAPVPPGTPPAAPPPAAAPPPQVTPSSNSPAAPAPAAPGPGTTQQATSPPAAAPPPAAPPPAAAPPPPTMDTKVPPTLTPTETKTEPAKTPEQPKLVWDKDDPDTVPTINGKPNIIRRATYPMSDEYKVARQEIAKADVEYQKQQDWLAYKQKTTKGTDAYQRTLMQLRNDIETTHRNKVARAQSVISEWNKQSAAHDAQERADLKYVPLKGEDKVTETARIDAKLEDHVKDEGKNYGPYKANPIRLYNTKEKWGDIRDAVLAVKALNPQISTDKLTEHVLTMLTHVEEGDTAQSQTANGETGVRGSRFRVVGEDLARNPVVGMGDKANRIFLHIPRDTLTDIKRLKTESYKKKKDADDAATAAAALAKKEAAKPSRYIPDQLRNTIETVKQTATEASKKAEEAGMVMKPDAPTSEDLTTSQKREADARRRREGARAADERRLSGE